MTKAVKSVTIAISSLEALLVIHLTIIKSETLASQLMSTVHAQSRKNKMPRAMT